MVHKGGRESLEKQKKLAYKRAQRKKDDDIPKNLEKKKKAAKDFEEAANKAKEEKIEEFSLSVSQDRTLYKFWQFHGVMNNAKKANEVPNFRRKNLNLKIIFGFMKITHYIMIPTE